MTAPVLFRIRVAFVPVGSSTFPGLIPVDTCQVKLAAAGGAVGASHGETGEAGGIVVFYVTFWVRF